jgi:hypothetical protein
MLFVERVLILTAVLAFLVGTAVHYQGLDRSGSLAFTEIYTISGIGLNAFRP